MYSGHIPLQIDSRIFLYFYNFWKLQKQLINIMIFVTVTPNIAFLESLMKTMRGKTRTKRTEILYIFFGIDTANVVQLADGIEQRGRLAAA